jgi:transcriptional regulator with XRE-family HTH domain
MGDDLDDVLTAVGPRLRALRRRRGTTLAQLAEATGISASTLSRLESGQRRPTLELLLRLARAHAVALDELVAAPVTGDPRVHPRPFRRHGMTFVPLTRRPGGLRAYKQILPAGAEGALDGPLDLQTHEGHGWIYVLSGRLRLILGDHDLVLVPGEVAEFDTRVPHAYTSAGPEPVEILSLFGRQGERPHVRASPG